MTTEAMVNVRGMKSRFARAAVLGAAVAGLALVGACASSTVREGRGGSYLIIEALEGASGGGQSAEFSTVLQSDVQTNGGVFEDPGRVRLRLALKDIGTASSPTSPTTNNLVTINRYHVAFQRSDGRNQPGRDVPYPFDGAITFTVGAQPASASFSIVRAQAKLEAPLKAMVGGGGNIVLSTIATVTFYGADQAGNEVSVTGTISINFADWADSNSSS